MQYIQTGTNNPEYRRVYFHLVDATDGITPEAGEAGGRPTISINGRTPANTVNTLSAVDASKGDYYLELSPSEIVNPAHLLLHYKSANTTHFAQQVQVMAFDPYTWFGTLGGGGGVDIDYKRINKIIDEAVDNLPKPEKTEVDLIPIVEGLHSVVEEIRSLDIPKPKEVDFSPITQKLNKLEGEIRGIEIPKTDLSPVLEALNAFGDVLDGVAKEQKEIKNGLLERVKDFFANGLSQIEKQVSGLGRKIGELPYVVVPEAKEKKKDGSSVLKEYLNLK